ncbi:CBS domain-containing protein [Halomonas nitroreducens]|uniref:CBS domain-containing protein n=1 Tax=Halomonas nitroreducens TaxID=447425 RepID=A0A431V7H4_9GAMM|nr:CBS domain-containing protein [Halomonas nitroreducens]RTR06921.1 CBS domain-containing protein [Halomonas nitroreducens]
MRIGECCNRDLVIAAPHTEILDAAKMMRRHHVGDLIIAEMHDGLPRPLGMLTDRDLVVEVMAQEVSPSEITVADVMTPELVTVPEDLDVWETGERMRHHGVRRMPVVDQDGALVGLITLDDLLVLFTETLDNMTCLIRTEMDSEAKRRKA